ncbi:unnamed protein product [Microthlaspi erraticum]|uniref:RNase H type-1 domain-containing protein n=1 Tax=Microthlaspi erraticum TaxID=1685480 RepID=A0A6D2HFP0_9BRAS|nr:unnamed protein product [Microthlaspi erraticum]
MFAVAVWWAWKWRYNDVFGDNTLWRNSVKFRKDYVKGVHSVTMGGGRTGVVHRVEREILWLPPLVSWMKLNIDSASHGNPGLATAGGAIQNGYGQWCGGFALNIGRCTAPVAELWGVYYSLCIAWKRGITSLKVEIDSLMVVGFLMTGICDTHPLLFLVHMCHGLLVKNWKV